MVGRGEVGKTASWLLVEPAELPGRRPEVCRTDSLERMPPAEILRSWLTTLAASLWSVVSLSEPRSRWDFGNMPHLPLELVPDQHQCP